jgi:hypothetical protein
LRPLPFETPERLVMVWDDFRPTGVPPRGEPERLAGARTTANLE